MKKPAPLRGLHFLNVTESDSLERPRGLIGRAIHSLRLPLRERSPIDRNAAGNRAVRMFAANFKSTWTR